MKRILIIGANSAIAVACARLWAGRNCEFFLVARNASKLDQTAADLRARGARSVTVHAMDATAYAAHSAMFGHAVGALKQIDVALISYGNLPVQKASEQNTALALKEFETNCTSVIALMNVVALQLEHQRAGTLAVLSSVAGDRGRASNYLYGAAKAAVSTACEGLRARMYKAGVHVVTIKPGFVDTPMTQGLALPAALLAQPDQVAKQIVRAIERKTNTLYTPRFWQLIMFIIRNIPQALFKRLEL